MNNWLQKYTYHDTIPWWMFGDTSLSTLLITLLTMSYQAIRVALLNP